MINIAVCDDDLVFATSIETILLHIAKTQCLDLSIDVYSDGTELWSAIREGINYDLLYLDIEMFKVSGIEVAQRIREENLNVLIIFISSYENYFIELFEVEPFRFIKKPICKRTFYDYFFKAYERLIDENTYYEYKFNKIVHKIVTKDILYFCSSGRLINIVHLDGIDKFYGKINNIEKELNNGKIPFLRIHQSYLVNYRYVRKVSFSTVTLIDGTELHISEDRQKAIRFRYSELLGGEFLDV